MYVAEMGSPLNHAARHCVDGGPIHIPTEYKSSDGQKIRPVLDKKDRLQIPFPQPEGMLNGGTHFNALVFLQSIKPLYEKVVVQQLPEHDLSIEDIAFLKLLEARIEEQIDDGQPAFRLWPTLQLTHTADLNTFIFEKNGSQYLRLLCLQDSS